MQPDPPVFNFDISAIQRVIQSIPEEERRRFPAHIFEPERIEIARELFLKEQYKLYPHIQPADFERMGQEILQWLPGKGYELAPVVDFWNYIDGTLLTLKLKHIIPALTSDHITWKREQIAPKQLTLVAPIGTLGEFGQPPYTYDFIAKHIINDQQRLEQNRLISDQKSKSTAIHRDHYPVIVRRELDGTLVLLDGNRRSLRALLYEQPTIDAWVGTVLQEPTLHDHWVNTGIMQRLLTQYEQNPSDEVKASIKSQLHIILRSSRIARINFTERCEPSYPFAAELAQDAIDQ